MKVIEDRCPFNVSMAKSKKRAARKASVATTTEQQFNNYQQLSDDRESDGNSKKRPSCNHITKSVNMPACRKALKGSVSVQCSGCLKDEPTMTDVNGLDNSTWFCLQCGYQGCSRYHPAQHGLKHWKQPRSDPHSIAINTSSWMIWCYECDDELSYKNTKSLTDIVSLIKKQLGVSKHSRPNSTENAAELLISSSAPVVQRKCETAGGGAIAKTGPKMKGLSNLGNTCFFNAVIQSLSQVRELNELLSDMRQSDDVTLSLPGFTSPGSLLGSDCEDSEGDDSRPAELAPLSVQLGKDSMALTDSLVKLFGDMWSDEGPKQSLNPSKLFNQLCSRVPRFKGYQQQDSHELLRNLLDSLKNEELKRIQAGILNTFNYKNLDEQAKKLSGPKIKCYGQQARHTTVDSLFGGYLLSTVLCNECNKASQIFEPFLDLSLPVYEEKGRHEASRKGSRSKSSSVDGVTPTEERNGPSKYQQKKAAKAAKKNKKSKNKATEGRFSDTPLTEVTPLLDAEPTDTRVPTVENREVGAGAGVDSASRSLSTGEQSDSPPSSPPTPKSEHGYSSDSEGSSTEHPVNGVTSHSMEKLTTSLMESCAVDRTHSARIRNAVDSSLQPLSHKLDCAPQDCSILSSLGQFTHPELLAGSNKFACSFCNRKARKAASTNEKVRTVYTDARKQMTVYSPPAILTLHLKRFQQNGFSFSKVNKHVDFTVNLDLAPYCSSLAQGVAPGETTVKYLLFAVVEHSGRLNAGHYTAYVRQRTTSALHKNMLQKSLYNEKPLTVLLDRVSMLQRELGLRENSERRDSLDASSNAGDGATELHRRWYHISDTRVKEVSERSVLSSQAYLLFYERVR